VGVRVELEAAAPLAVLAAGDGVVDVALPGALGAVDPRGRDVWAAAPAAPERGLAVGVGAEASGVVAWASASQAAASANSDGLSSRRRRHSASEWYGHPIQAERGAVQPARSR
jgi:hypothetical protein